MSEIIDAPMTMPADGSNIDVSGLWEGANQDDVVQDAFAASLQEFAELDTDNQLVILFAMLRSMAATVVTLDRRVDEFEAKAKALASPEGIQELMNTFMGGAGSGLLGGMLGGKY